MKKKELCNKHKSLRKTFGLRCYDLRCDDEIEQKKGNKISYKSTSMKQLATVFSADISDRYDTSKISRLENAKAEVTILDLYLYHKHYNVSYDFLMGVTSNKKNEDNGIYEKYGLTDTTLNILKTFVTNKCEKELLVLNEIFKSGLVQPFLDALCDYIYNDYEKRLPSGYKTTNAELVEVELITKAGKLNLGNDIIPLEKLNSLNRQLLYDKLEQIKNILNKPQNDENKSKQIKNPKNFLNNMYRKKC